jgi:hypothetical protein
MQAEQNTQENKNKSMGIIEYLEKNGILWQPISLKDKVPVPFTNGIYPAPNDYKHLSNDEIIKRQNMNDSEVIAIFTNVIQQIDIDNKNATKKYDFLKNAPYFESLNRKLPHYFVYIKEYKGERTGIVGGDVLTGQWSYCRKDALVFQSSNEIKEFKTTEFEVPIITETNLNDKVEKLREAIGPDCDYPKWFSIIQNLFNIASKHLFDDPHKFAHNFSKDSNKYDGNAIKAIDNLKTNGYNMKTCLNNITKLITSNTTKSTKEEGNDDEIIDEFFNENEGLVYYCDEELWYKDDIFVWRNNKETVKNLVFQWLFFNKKDLSTTKRNQLKTDIISAASVYCRDEEFEKKFYESTRGKLCFKNGVLDIATKTFDEWGTKETKNIFTRISIPYNYEKCDQIVKEELLNRVFRPIFDNNEILIKEHLLCTIRALFGHVDKYYSVWVGVRNSGKGVLTLLYTTALSGYVGPFDANNLIKVRKSDTENSRKNAWKIPFALYRLVIGNEMSVDDNSFIDGIEIKQIASGGDKIVARQIYAQDKEYKLEGHMLIMVNDISDIKPKDAYSNMLYVEMPCTFQEEKSELAVRRDADLTIKDFVASKAAHLAMIEILLDNYNIPNYTEMKSKAKDLVEETEENVLGKILEIYEKTNNVKDSVLASDFDKEMKKIGLVFTTAKRKRYMDKLKIEQKRITKGFIYTSLRLRNNKDEECMF